MSHSDNVSAGNLAELRFEYEVTRRAMICCVAPQGCVFDCVVVRGRRVWRIQIKSARLYRPRNRQRSRYSFKMGRRGYSRRTVDIIALYKVDEDTFVFFPAEKHGSRRGVTLIPERTRVRNVRAEAGGRRLHGWEIFSK